jgi:hypothetical protein
MARQHTFILSVYTSGSLPMVMRGVFPIEDLLHLEKTDRHRSLLSDLNTLISPRANPLSWIGVSADALSNVKI